MPPYHPAIIKSDTLFSAWVFCWAVIYCIAKYYAPLSSIYELLQTYANPVFGLLFIVAFQIYAFIQIIINVRPFDRFPSILTKFFALSFVFKLLPLYFVVGVPPLNVFLKNVFDQSLTGGPVFIVALFLYLAYIKTLGLDIFEIYEDLIDSFIKDDNRILLYRWVSKTIPALISSLKE
jgi:hypothetical protein